MSGLSVAFAGIFSLYAIRRSGLDVCSRTRSFLPTPWSLPGYTGFAKWDRYQIASRRLPEGRGYPFLYVVGGKTIGCDTSMT